MNKERIIEIFSMTVCYPITSDMYYVNTKEVSFTYNGKLQKIPNVTLLNLNENCICFNDEYKFNINKIGSFMISTERSNIVHPMVENLFPMKDN